MTVGVKTKTKLKTLVKAKEEEDFIINLFDNYKERAGVKTGWGFSCFIKREEGSNILFDTGANGKDLLFNMKEVGISPKEIDLIFLSHIHNDHTGGLIEVLEKNPDLLVVMPASFPIDFKNKIEEKGVKIREINKFNEIEKNTFSTGEFSYSTKEHSLVLKTKNGLVLITGCAHPGILNIIERVNKNFSDSIYLVLGGFHSKGESQIKLEEIIKKFKEINIKKVAPSHCSGDRMRRLFEEKYEDRYIRNGAGKIINI